MQCNRFFNASKNDAKILNEFISELSWVELQKSTLIFMLLIIFIIHLYNNNYFKKVKYLNSNFYNITEGSNIPIVIYKPSVIGDEKFWLINLVYLSAFWYINFNFMKINFKVYNLANRLRQIQFRLLRDAEISNFLKIMQAKYRFYRI